MFNSDQCTCSYIWVQVLSNYRPFDAYSFSGYFVVFPFCCVAINTMKSKADATASRAIRSKNRLVAQPEGRNVQPVDVLNIQRALLNKKSPTLYHSFKFGQERKSLSLPPPSHESGKRESTVKSASGKPHKTKFIQSIYMHISI